MKSTTIILLFVLAFANMNAQEKSSVSVSGGVDFYNRYIWRGLMFSDAPNIQPYLTFSAGGFSATAWGSYATSDNYAEIDLFLSYSVGNLTFNLNDYYSEDETDLSANDYSNWDKTDTPHLIEASVSYQLPFESFPLTILGSTFLYGSYDLDDNQDQNYTTYFEAQLPCSAGDYDLSFALGGAVNGGYYSNDAAIVNFSIGASRSIKVTESFSVPVNTALIFNPDNKDVFLTLGFSL